MTEEDETIIGYVSAKLDGSSTSFVDLLESASEEGSLNLIRLTDHVGPTPAMLTPAMSRWYARHVAPLRKRALDRVADLFKRVGDDQHAEAIFLERRLDEIEDERIASKRRAQESHAAQNTAQYERLRELQGEYQRSRREYDTLHARHRREPKTIHWWYYLILSVVGVAEAFVNFESFSALPLIASPAMALGTTVVIAIALAISSHFHGTFIKEWGTRFGPHRREHDIAAAWKAFSLGTTGLVIVLAAVWYARAYFLADAVRQMEIMGGEPPSWLAVVGGSLVTNLVVWIVGVMIAWSFHDEDPHFADAYRARQKTEQRYRDAQEKLSKPLGREFKRIDADAERLADEARGQDASLQVFVSYQEARRFFDQVTAKDREVLAALEAYRGELLRRISNSGCAFGAPEKLDRTAATSLTTADYSAESLRLKHL